MRGVVFALVFAAVAAAQEVPLLHSTGTSLDTFEVRVNVAGVRNGTAGELAASFARLQEDAQVVRRRFAELFRDEHLDILRRYYAPEMVKKQAAWYLARARRDYRCEVEAVEQNGRTATARLKRSWLPPKGARRHGTIDLALREQEGAWLVTSIRDEVEGKGAVERGLGVPPPERSIEIPAAPPPDRTSSKATVRSLHLDVKRLGAIRNAGSRSIQRRYFDILAAIFGEEVAKEARAKRPDLKPQPEILIEILEPEPRVGDMVRVKVLVNEKVPGAKDLVSSIGQAAFDLRPQKGKWRIVNEFRRLRLDQALVPSASDFALVFLVG